MLSGGFRFALPTLRNYEAKEKRKRNADRRVYPTSASRDAARTNGALAYRRSTRLLPSGLSAPGRNSRPGFLGRGRTFDPASSLQPGSEDLAFLHGVTRARLSQSRERTSRTGRSAGQHDARTARSCPKLPEAARSCPKLPEAAGSYPKLPEAARSCPKLPEAARIAECSHRAGPGPGSTCRKTFATGVLGERNSIRHVARMRTSAI